MGAVSLDRPYIGIEPCERQVSGLERTLFSVKEMNPARGRASLVSGSLRSMAATVSVFAECIDLLAQGAVLAC